MKNKKNIKKHKKSVKAIIRKTRVLKLPHPDEEKEIRFELDFMESLTFQERFQMMLEKNKLIKKLLESNGHRKAAGVFKRS